MKNSRYIQCFSEIEPDEAASERMLSQVRVKISPDKKERKTLKRKIKWFAPAAACLVLVLAIAGYYIYGFSVLTEKSGSYTLNFYKSGLPAQDVFYSDGDITSRDLTAEENRFLFGGIEDINSYGFFDVEKGLLRVEARVADRTEILFSKEGHPVTDTVIAGNRKISVISGVKVAAGYFITDKNSEGIRDIIYFADFKLSGVSYHVRLGGKKSESGLLRTEISSVIFKLIQNGAPDLSTIPLKNES